MISHHLHLLRCPITHLPLRQAKPSELAIVRRVAETPSAGWHETAKGFNVDAALTNLEGSYAYPVIQEIACLLSRHAVCLGSGRDGGDDSDESQNDLIRSVQDFYDRLGWKGRDGGEFLGERDLEDTREISREYVSRCRLRLRDYIPARGRYLLDVACGPILYDEYLKYAEGYDKRICVDISMTALLHARRRIGDQGLYLVGNITDLPLATGLIDAAVSLHTIYHVPLELQFQAFRELRRVLRPGAVAAVVYSWGDRAPLMMPLALIGKIYRSVRGLSRRVRRLLGDRQETQPPQSMVYFRTHGFGRVTKELADIGDCQVLCWRSLSIRFLQYCIHPRLQGTRVLSIVFDLESRYPELFGRLGQYPLIILKKH